VAEEILAPFTHVCSLSSKGIRGRLIDAFNVWCGLTPAVLDGVKVCVDMLHNASLLIDDIEDGSEMRRGAPAAHRVYGMPLTLNCANQVYFIAMQKVLSLPAVALSAAASSVSASASSSSSSSAAAAFEYYRDHLATITMNLSSDFAEEMICLHEGQGMDILWRDTHRCPSMAEYDLMVLKKTGGLFRLALRLMMTLAVPKRTGVSASSSDSSSAVAETNTVADAVTSDRLSEAKAPKTVAVVSDDVAADAPQPHVPVVASIVDPLSVERREKYVGLVETIGVFFQTLDDYLNVSCEAYHQSKSYCEDLTEGKFSYPIIHSILASGPHDQRLFHLLKQRPTDIPVKQYCVKLMEETGSLEATRVRVEVLRQEVYGLLGAIGGSPMIDECMQKMCKLMGVRA